MLLCAWAAEYLEGEPEVRTVLFATGTIMSYAWTAFLPIAAFPAEEAPNWRVGSKVYLGLACLAAAIFVGIHFGLKWTYRDKNGEGRRTRATATLEHVRGILGKRESV